MKKDFFPELKGLSLKAYKDGKTFVLIPSLVDQDVKTNQKDGDESHEQLEVLQGILRSDSHFEVIKANTEAFTGEDEDEVKEDKLED